jgi:hypothetical protein
MRAKTGFTSSVPAEPDEPIADSKNKMKNKPAFIIKFLLENIQKMKLTNSNVALNPDWSKGNLNFKYFCNQNKCQKNGYRLCYQ